MIVFFTIIPLILKSLYKKIELFNNNKDLFDSKTIKLDGFKINNNTFFKNNFLLKFNSHDKKQHVLLMIPKIIHQIWFGDQSKRPVEYMNKWKDMNPTWEYRLWTEADIANTFGKLVNQKHFDSLPRLYNTLKSTSASGNIKEHHYLCGQSDIARYEILYKFGGFFIDADAIPLKPLPDVFCDNDSFSVYENEIVRPNLIANGYLATCKYNILMEYMIQELKRQNSLLYNEPWIVTGPMFLTNMVKKYRYTGLKVYPSYYFIPNHYTGKSYNGLDTDNIYCDQLWGSTKNNIY